jgi:hypothetical protein
LFAAQCQRVGQQQYGFALRGASVAAFECTDTARAHPGALRERFLREATFETVTAQEFAES